MYFFVYTPEMVKDLKAAFGEEYEEFIPAVGDIRGFRRAFGGERIAFLEHVDSGEVLGPNWVAMSKWRVTLQAVHQAIGGKLIIPKSTPLASPTQST